jgi:hypothetical protein
MMGTTCEDPILRFGDMWLGLVPSYHGLDASCMSIWGALEAGNTHDAHPSQKRQLELGPHPSTTSMSWHQHRQCVERPH